LADPHRHAEVAALRLLGVPRTLMGELVQDLRELIADADLLDGVLRDVLQGGGDLLPDLNAMHQVLGELVQGGSDLLLLHRMLGLSELLAETLGEAAGLAEWALSELSLSE
jgi:hypothetical protein